MQIYRKIYFKELVHTSLRRLTSPKPAGCVGRLETWERAQVTVQVWRSSAGRISSCFLRFFFQKHLLVGFFFKYLFFKIIEMVIDYFATVMNYVAQLVKNPPAMQETSVWFLGGEDPLEEGMATHSSILAWRIPWTEEPSGLQSMGSQRVGPNWVTKHAYAWWITFILFIYNARLNLLRINLSIFMRDIGLYFYCNVSFWCQSNAGLI